VHYLPISGHHPYDVPVPGPFVGGSEARRYLNALHYSDLALKKLVEGLEKRGVLENTLLIVYGDHGEAFGEHPGNYGHTLYLYEENVRVPLIFWMPAKLRPTRLSPITSLIDVAPTVCDLLGFQTPASFDGVSAFGNVEKPVFFFTEYSMRLRGVRFRDWKLILEDDTGYARLYDLKSDRAERTNVAGAHPEIANRLRRFFEWSEAAPRSTVAVEHDTLAQQ
jgi:lipoteichoic acid synthase